VFMMCSEDSVFRSNDTPLLSLNSSTLEIAPHAYACFVTNKISHTIESVSENLFERQHLFMVWVIDSFKSSLLFE
jgi:hypothetical protein